MGSGRETQMWLRMGAQEEGLVSCSWCNAAPSQGAGESQPASSKRREGSADRSHLHACSGSRWEEPLLPSHSSHLE